MQCTCRSDESGGSDSEDGSVSRRKKKTSREKDKSRKAKKDKAAKGTQCMSITKVHCVHVLCACAFTVQANVIMGNLLAVGGVRLQYESTTCQYMRWSGGLAFFLEVMVQLYSH